MCLLLNAAASRPTLILFEDAHWADPTSLELLDAVAARVQDLCALLLITIRDDSSLRVKKLTHVTSLRLNRLTHTQSLKVVHNVLQNAPLPMELVEQIVSKSDGIPIFLEEITKTVQERINQQATDGAVAQQQSKDLMTIPATLYDSLMSRLADYPEVKETAGCASAIGREFSEPLLSAVLGLEPAETRSRVIRLIEAGLVFRDARRAGSNYTFKHALVQDAAYESMMKSTRSELPRPHREYARVNVLRRR